MSDADAALDTALQSLVGGQGSVQVATEPVGATEVSAWCAVMSEANPLFVDEAVAASGPYGGIVAPPATLNMWTMPVRIGRGSVGRDTDQPQQAAYQLLDDAGFTGVVATNSDQAYEGHLRPGDIVSTRTTLTGVSPQKQTALGTGHFVTTEVAYANQHGDPVGTLTFRIFKFRPGTGRQRGDEPVDDSPRPERPRPRWNQDQAWHWEGLRQHELRIQRFTGSGRLVHPPVVADPTTHDMAYDWVVASGRGFLYSWTAPEHPKVPAFDYPLVVGLVELEEGVRVVSNIVGVRPDQLEIGMPLEVCWLDSHDDVTLHQFRPTRPDRRTDTLVRDDVSVGDRLPHCPIEITTELVTSGALATFDHQDVHHDSDAARAKGLPDIIMNILTSSGLAARWLGDWAGDRAVFRNLRIGLGASNHPGDTMTMAGSVTDVGEGGAITVAFVGTNSLGNHIHGSAELTLPEGPQGAGGSA
ncbi:MAG TPA: OB-fold domain-containing protein [Acidimicrobiales bacterium]|jgi:uncharacterized OB-fold protein/acyl dehydratase|nr:OB-fold domain-containing protein [Acidimicrobiales bacterium]|tara:strand:- start:21320 stop:22732 length:1413 start_codon:yes stop_codon:yes gene_type:complete